MNFFDSLINDIESEICKFPEKNLSFNENECWAELKNSTVLMLRDTAFELKGIGFNLVTENSFNDEIILVGKDIAEIKKDTPFSRVCIISVSPEAEEQELYKLIRKIEYVKYRFFPEGYMIRSSSDSQKEAVRVSKKAVKEGISFENIGSLLIKKLKNIPEVKAAKVIFVTEEGADYKLFQKIARKSDDITKALNHIMNTVSFDCDSCGLKAICDEVEGMKEMHFKVTGNGYV